jgi:hypothetical protein
VAQAARPELLPRVDPGGAGQAAHQLREVTLAEPPAGRSQQGPRQLPPAGHSGAVSPVGRLGIQGRHHGGRGKRICAFQAPIADHPVAAVLAEVVDAHGPVQQQPHHGRVPSA